MTHTFTYRGEVHRCEFDPATPPVDLVFKRGNPAPPSWVIYIGHEVFTGPVFTGTELLPANVAEFEKAAARAVRVRR